MHKEIVRNTFWKHKIKGIIELAKLNDYLFKKHFKQRFFCSLVNGKIINANLKLLIDVSRQKSISGLCKNQIDVANIKRFSTSTLFMTQK